MPLVSIIVPVRLARHTIVSTLEALLAEAEGRAVEVIVAVSKRDPAAALILSMAHPQLRVLIADAPAGVPQLRRDAALAARGEYIVITEDHCLPPQNWVEGLVSSICSHETDVSGGGVANGRRSWTGWAQYFTRYSAFLPPCPDSATRHLPGNNACYRTDVLKAHQKLLTEGFWEAEFNQELLASGCRFWISPALTVVQRQQRSLFEYFPLRFRHGRCYGARRINASTSKSALLLRSPLIPPLLMWRATRSALMRAEFRWRFLYALPLFALYVLAWSMGEWTGYFFGPGSSCTETD